jgi:hypothetical protein
MGYWLGAAVLKFKLPLINWKKQFNGIPNGASSLENNQIDIPIKAI